MKFPYDPQHVLLAQVSICVFSYWCSAECPKFQNKDANLQEIISEVKEVPDDLRKYRKWKVCFS